MFIDKARIYVHAGKGGNGCLSFRREKYVPHGGPDGGPGGKGGDIILRVSPSLKTLYDFQCRSHYSSANGTPGQGGNKAGRNSKDLVLYVPSGTAVYRDGKILADLVPPVEEIIIVHGGRGGRGNSAFKSSKNRAPRIAERGEPGEEAIVDLELKLIADVGIAGYPNAGKSTFLSKVTHARPKIADYPFTTLTPNLGVLKFRGNHLKDKEIIFADIPGLIEGAHLGKGLGRDFLRHIERTKVILHLIDIFGYQGKSAKEIFFALNSELELYNPELLKKPMLVGLNKIDLPGTNSNSYRRGKSFSFGRKKYPIFLLSALTGEGTKEICLKILKILDSLPKEIKKEELQGDYVFLPDFEVEKKGNIFHVCGKKSERLVAMTNFSQEEAVKRLQNIFRKMGLEKVLEKKGINKGDTVKIGEWEFIWQKGLQ